MRGFMQYFQKHLGIPVVTENIPGGLSAVGLIRLKTARPDGYTIGTLIYDVLTLSVQGLAPVGWEDFDLVGTVTEHPSALIVAADAFDSLGAFQTAARSRRVKVGNIGSGGIWHQHTSAMERALEVSVAHIPYEAGSGAQLTALLGGEVDAKRGEPSRSATSCKRRDAPCAGGHGVPKKLAEREQTYDDRQKRHADEKVGHVESETSDGNELVEAHGREHETERGCCDFESGPRLTADTATSAKKSSENVSGD